MAMRGAMPLRGHRGSRGSRVLRGGNAPRENHSEREQQEGAGESSTEQAYSEAPQSEQRRYNNESKA
jgi:hypothetical protein